LSDSDIQYEYIDQQAQLEGLVARLRGVCPIAVDIEADSFHHYYPKVCLIQLSFGGDNFILDPLAKLDLSAFFNCLAGKKIIFHDAGYDLRMLRSDFGFEPTGEIFDTMLAGKLLRLESLNLAGMLNNMLDVIISKFNQKADWSKRPLPESLLQYAALDTHYLLELAQKLELLLQEQQRTGWHKQMCQRSVQAAIRHTQQDNPDKDFRIKGSSDLSRRQLAFLKSLWQWREQQAQQADLPPFRIMHNERLVAMAVEADAMAEPEFTELCATVKHCKGKRLMLLHEALGAAFEQDSSTWPAKKSGIRPPRPEKSYLERVDKLRQCCQQVAETNNLAVELLLPRAAIAVVAKSGTAGLTQLLEEGVIVPWQVELLQVPVENCLGSDNPPGQ
jgi:ribonuclease D